MRILIVIPVIHTLQDMGSLHELTRQAYVVRYGDEKWLAHLKSIDQVWSGIRQMIEKLELPCARVRLYQDGLPLCGNEIEIVREVAAQGSQNYQILLELITQGATLTGTEDANLLLQEYQLHQDAATTDSLAQENIRKVRRQAILAARDQFIANRINSTLSEGEIGLLFLGMAHAVESLLDADILVRPLLPSLQEKQEGIRCPA